MLKKREIKKSKKKLHNNCAIINFYIYKCNVRCFAIMLLLFFNIIYYVITSLRFVNQLFEIFFFCRRKKNWIITLQKKLAHRIFLEKKSEKESN